MKTGWDTSNPGRNSGHNSGRNSGRNWPYGGCEAIERIPSIPGVCEQFPGIGDVLLQATGVTGIQFGHLRCHKRLTLAGM